MYKLLIADDEYETRHGLSSYFPWHDLGFEMSQAVENGFEALAYVESHSIDVLLCDIMMPGVTGLEVAEQLHRRKSPVQVILLSAHQDFSFAQKAMQVGVRNYILKPTKYQEIFDVFSAVKAMLDERGSAQALPANMHSPILDLEPVESASGNIEQMTDPTIKKIVKYVQEHFKEATLEGAAQTVYMSPSYVSKYFKKMTLRNFSDYLNDVRMSKAAELLQQKKLRVYEISETVGYINSQNFARSFKRHFGKTPHDYVREIE